MFGLFKVKPKKVIVQSYSRTNHKDRHKYKRKHVELAKEIGDVQALARLNECWCVK